MSAESISIAAVFLLYLAGMLAIGVFFFRRTESVSDYFLGDRSLNKWVTSLSAQASDMSGWLLMGLPGAAYVSGLASAWIAIGLAIGTYLNWRLVATRLRVYTAVREDTITLTDYLEYRFRASGKVLRIISAVLILIFFLIYTSSGFVAGGKLFSAVFGFPYTAALIVGAFVVVSYTFLGGFRAVCWTDFVQATLMFFAILLVPITAVVLSGGPAATISSLHASVPHFFEITYLKDGIEGVGLWIAIISSMAWGLGYFGQPHILVRFMAIRSPRDMGGACRIAITWVLISLTGAVLAGIAGRFYLGVDAVIGDPEKVFILTVQQMFPAAIAGVFLAAILAAIMSTADSQLLVTTSAITEDLYKALLRKDASENELVWVGRLTVVGVAIVAVCLALNPDSSVLELVAYAWAGFGAAFGPAILFSLFWRRMTHGGALAGLITGGLTVLIWKQLEGGLFDVYEIVPGFLFSSVAIIIASMAGPRPNAEILDEFTAVADEADRCRTGTV